MIDVLHNQPIQTMFNCCNCDEYSRMQYVIPTDLQRVQVRLTPHGTPIELINATSWNKSGAWSEANGVLSATGAGFIYKSVSLEVDRTYEIRFHVDITQLGDDGGYRLNVNNQWVALPDARDGAYSILQGDMTVFVTINTLTATPQIFFQTAPGAAITVLEISEVTIAMLSRPGLQVLNASKEVIQDFEDANTIEEPNTNIATVWIDWSEVNYSGVCYLCIYDVFDYNSQLLFNGDFGTDVGGWDNNFDNSLQWNWFAGPPTRAQYQGLGTSHNDALSQALEVPGGALYQLAFTVSGIGIGSGEGVRVWFIVNGDELAYTDYTMTGPYTQSLDLSSYTGIVQLRVVFQPINTSDTIFVYSISLKRLLDSSNITNPFLLQSKHSGTKVFFGRCYSSSFGFDFTNFWFKIRVRADVEYISYPDNTEIYEWSNNVEEVLDAESKKHYRVTIYGNPEYIHDTLRLIELCDDFAIGEVYYIKATSYELKKTEGVCNSGAQFEVRAVKAIPSNSPGITDNYADDGYVDKDYWSGVYVSDSKTG